MMLMYFNNVNAEASHECSHLEGDWFPALLVFVCISSFGFTSQNFCCCLVTVSAFVVT